MNDPERLLESHELHPAQRKLLMSVKGEVPSDAVLRTLLAGAASAPGSLAESFDPGPSAPPVPTTSVAPVSGGKMLLGWIGLGTGLLALGSAVLLTPEGSPDRSAALPLRSAPAATEPPPVELPPAEPSPEAEVLATPTRPPGLDRSPSPNRARAEQEGTRGARRTGLAEEVAILEEVRAALRTGNGERSLVLLRTYSRRFPHGMLRPEAETLRIEAQTFLEKSRASSPQGDSGR